MKGASIGSWRVTGVGERRGEIGFEFARWPGNAANAAMEDAARKFIDGVELVPEVRHLVRQKHAVSARYLWPLEFQ